MGWELIGGDPAPGSPDSVAGASATLRRVADLAAKARTDLVTQTGAAGIERWQGSAADAFRDDVSKLPADLDTVRTSYEHASAALADFRTVLEGAQAEARSALALAQQAKADQDAASARHRNAQSEVDALTVSRLKAQASLAALQTQQKLSLDPTHRTSLSAPITSTKTQVNRLGGDLDSAKQAVRRFQAQIDDADNRLRQAHQRADRVRGTLANAVDNAVNALKLAERDAHLPSWLQEHAKQAEQWVVRNADTIKTVLSVVQMICSVASLVFPVAAPVLMGVSLACGVAILATDLIKDANSPEGFSTGNLLGLGGDFLGIVASAAGFGMVTKMASASKGFEAMKTASQAARDLSTARTLSTVVTWAGRGQQALGVAEDVADNGWQGGVFSVGTMVLGHYGAKAGGEALQKGLTRLNSGSAVNSHLQAMSDSLGRHNPAPNLVGIPIDEAPDTRSMQSLLTSGHNNSVGDQLADEYAERVAEPVSDFLADKANEVGQGLFTRDQELTQQLAAGPEIDIDLNPSPYGSSR